MGNVIIKQNPRNIVIVTPLVVFKYRHDWNIRKIFWEFVLTWKAFLNGVSDIPLLFGPVMLRKTTKGTILAKAKLEPNVEKLIRAVATLSSAGIEHLELRHPQYHVFLDTKGKIKIIDFERGKLTKTPRNLSRVTVWLIERGCDVHKLKEILNKIENAPKNDIQGARTAIKIAEERKKLKEV